MVAYSFQKRFAPLIVDGSKRQTIRAHRKRHARPGEALQLFTGMRTKYCKKIISDPVCAAVEDITLFVPTGFEPEHIISDGVRSYVTPEFAIADGFEDIHDFTRFWHTNHGPGEFHGVVIRWTP